MHRKLKDFIELIKLICPGCNEGYMYNEINSHMEKCEDAIKVKAEGRKLPAGTGQQQTQDQLALIQKASSIRRQTMANKFANV